MGFTALDGLPMGTRCGALDPGVLLYLMDQHGMDARALEKLIYQESGLLGVSGISSDMRTLLASPDPRAAEAIDLFVYRIGRELGSLAAALGGLDALVFTGGIGENAAAVRARVCRDAAWLGRGAGRGGQRAGGPRISRPGQPRRRLGRPHERGTDDRPAHPASARRDVPRQRRTGRRAAPRAAAKRIRGGTDCGHHPIAAAAGAESPGAGHRQRALDCLRLRPCLSQARRRTGALPT